MAALMSHSELTDLFNKYKNKESGLIKAEEIKNFLEVEQKERNVTLEMCKRILGTLLTDGEEVGITESEFTECILSKALNAAVDEEKRKVH